MSTDAREVTIVIPTRGDVDMHSVLASLPRNAHWILWNNSVSKDLGVFGRYAAINDATTEIIATQDDDAILTPEAWQALFDAYQPGKIVCNVPRRFRERYTDSGIVGFGAIFDRDLPAQAFARYAEFGGSVSTKKFQRTCDIVFTMLGGELVFVDVQYDDREFARAPDRMWRQPGHFEERNEMRNFCRDVRAGLAA